MSLCVYCQQRRQSNTNRVPVDCELVEKAFATKNPVTHSVYRQMLLNRLEYQLKKGETKHCEHPQYRSFLVENHEIIPLPTELWEVLSR